MKSSQGTNSKVLHNSNRYTTYKFVVKTMDDKTTFSNEFEVMINIVRKPDHLTSNILVPIYILACVVCLSYLINATGGERIGLIITVELAIVFVTTLVEEHAAPAGDLPPPMILGSRAEGHFNFM